MSGFGRVVGATFGSCEDGRGGSNHAEQSLVAFGVPAEKWMDRGLCRDYDQPDLWFPEVNGNLDLVTTYGKALDICGRCPVQVHCLEYALSVEDTEGMWGGLTPHERTRVLVQRAADEASGLGHEDLREVLMAMGRMDTPERRVCPKAHPLAEVEGAWTCKVCDAVRRKAEREAAFRKMSEAEKERARAVRVEEIRVRRNARLAKRRSMNRLPERKHYDRLWNVWSQGRRRLEQGRELSHGQREIHDLVAAGETIRDLVNRGFEVSAAPGPVLTELGEPVTAAEVKRLKILKKNRLQRARAAQRAGRELIETHREALRDAGELAP